MHWLITRTIILFLLFAGHPLISFADEAISEKEIVDKGRQLMDRKLYDAAVLEFDKVIDLDPQNAFAYSNRGYCFAMKGEFDTAVQDFTKAIEINPNYDDAICKRAKSYAALRKFKESFADYDRAIEINPQNKTAYLERGSIKAMSGDTEQALTDLNKAIELSPQDENGYFGRGMTYVMKKDYKDAIDDFTKVLEINSERYDALTSRAACYSELKEYDKAKEDVATLKQAQVPLPPAFLEALEKKASGESSDSGKDVAPAVSGGQDTKVTSGDVTVILKSGQKIEGKVLEQTKKYIKLDFEGTTVTYYQDEIDKINQR